MRPTLLTTRPVTTSVLFTVSGAFPLFLAAAQTARLQEDLGFGTRELGLAVAAYFVVAAAGSLLLGRAVDWMGPTASFRLSGAVAVVSALTIAMLAQSWSAIALGLGIAGLANTFAQLGSNLVLADRVPDRRQGLAFGIKQAAIPMGTLLAGLAVATIASEADWRIPFLVYALVAAMLALVTPTFPHQIHREHPRARMGQVVRGPLLALLVAGALGAATGNSLALLLVDSFVVAGFKETVAASFLALGSAASIGARVATGWYVDHNRAGGFPELASLMLIGSAGFALLAVSGDSRLLLLLGVLLGFAAGWGWPAVIYYVSVRVGRATPATATGFVLTGTYSGTVLGPPLFASLAEAASYREAWAVAAVCLASAAAMVMVARRLAAGAATER